MPAYTVLIEVSNNLDILLQEYFQYNNFSGFQTEQYGDFPLLRKWMATLPRFINIQEELQYTTIEIVQKVKPHQTGNSDIIKLS